MQLVVFRYFAHHLGLNHGAQEAARQLRSRVMCTGLDFPPGFNPGTGFRNIDSHFHARHELLTTALAF